MGKPSYMIKLMKTQRGSDFEYSGSVETGTIIAFGKRKQWQRTITATHYAALLKHFSARGSFRVGTSHTDPPKESMGDWSKANVTSTGIASYVAPILIAEGFAERTSRVEIRMV